MAEDATRMAHFGRWRLDDLEETRSLLEPDLVLCLTLELAEGIAVLDFESQKLAEL